MPAVTPWIPASNSGLASAKTAFSSFQTLINPPLLMEYNAHHLRNNKLPTYKKHNKYIHGSQRQIVGADHDTPDE